MRPLIRQSVTQLCVVSIIITMIIIFSGRISVCGARKRAKPPLIEDNTRRRPTRPTHCPFGNQTYEIEERWRPNLEPFGVFYCIRCECFAVHKKNRIVARVRCRNFKNDCPKPICDNPVLLPERCCKTCPGEDYVGLEDDLGLEVRKLGHDDDEMSGKQVIRMVTQEHVSPSGLMKPKNTESKEGTTKESNSQLEKNVLDDATNNLIGEPSYKCYYEGEIYEDGSQWKAQHIECEMCSCQRGRVKCEHELCPRLNCENATVVVGACCAICPNQIDTLNISAALITKGCYFEGDKMFHKAGTRWHPYLPPFGFDKCSLCSCLNDSLEIKCERKSNCPPLTCPEQEAYRENPMDCCKRCPHVPPVKAITSSDQLSDQRSSSGLAKSPNELMAAGGCRFKGRVFPNGEEWHPTVQPFGEVKCVKCHCKDGVHKCKRTVCPKISSCTIVINKNNQCCPICADDSDDLRIKSQPIVAPNRKRGGVKTQRKNKGRRALHRRTSY